MRNFTLNFFLSKHKLSQSVIGAFPHALHSKMLATPLVAYQVHLTVGASAQQGHALEISSPKLICACSNAVKHFAEVTSVI